jgi:hypothetical protein
MINEQKEVRSFAITTKRGEAPQSKEDKMCLHRFYVAPLEAAQSGHLTLYRQGSSSTAQGASECKVESHKIHIRNFIMQGSDGGIKRVSGHPTGEFKH